MYVGKEFQPSDRGESEVYSFDFANDLEAGETIASATWECEVRSGADTDPASRLIGPAVTSGAIVSQRVATLVPGTRYVLRCLVQTSLGNARSLFSFVAVNAKP